MSVGVRMLDGQHKKLIQMLNDFCNSLDEHFALEDILDSLTDYTQYHFTAEEKYLQDHNYPQYDEHLDSHYLFIGEIKRLQAKLRAAQQSERLQLSLEITLFLRNWLINHIAIEDQIYAKWIAANPKQG